MCQFCWKTRYNYQSFVSFSSDTFYSKCFGMKQILGKMSTVHFEEVKYIKLLFKRLLRRCRFISRISRVVRFGLDDNDNDDNEQKCSQKPANAEFHLQILPPVLFLESSWRRVELERGLLQIGSSRVQIGEFFIAFHHLGHVISHDINHLIDLDLRKYFKLIHIAEWKMIFFWRDWVLGFLHHWCLNSLELAHLELESFWQTDRHKENSSSLTAAW